MEQNFKNHRRYIPLWTFILPLIVLGIIIWGVVLFLDHHREMHFLGAFMVITSVILLLIWWYARAFALKAQDRAIRAEENFRHFILTGKPLDPGLRMGQIVALRFASDAEFPSLAKRAVGENLGQKEIKQAIKNWRADHYRV